MTAGTLYVSELGRSIVAKAREAEARMEKRMTAILTECTR